MSKLIAGFERTYRTKLESWRRELVDRQASGRRLVVWGAGSKTATFLNVLPPGSIEYVVDINPRKQGHFVPGSGSTVRIARFSC